MKRSRGNHLCRLDLYRFGWIFVVVSTVITPSIGLFAVVAQQQNPLTMNGGSVLAMAGKNCVVLAVDKRFGSGRSLINVRNRPIIQVPPSTIVAFTGMEGDVQSLHIELNAQIIDKYYRGLGFGERSKNNNRHDTSFVSASDVKAVAMLTSHILYRRKRAPYYVEPVVVGLRLDGWEEHDISNQNGLEGPTSLITTISPDTNHLSTSEDAKHLCERSSVRQALTESRVEQPNRVLGRRLRYRPYLCCMDMIGAKSESEAFACAGSASKSLYGTAEALWEPDLSPDELVSICTNAFLSALERDCLSGYGATVYLLTPDGITEYDISGRSD